MWMSISEGHEKVIRIGEEDDYEYLGVSIKATGQGMFRYHVDKIKQKVNRAKGMIKLTAMNSFNFKFLGEGSSPRNVVWSGRYFNK